MTFAIVTPTYAPDYERCRFLIETSRRFLKSSAQHYLVIDKQDYSVFKSLISENVKLVIKEEILPRRFKLLPLKIRKKSVWCDIKSGKVIRGWIIQQIVKLSASSFVNGQNIIFMDSDEFFIRDTNLDKVFIKNDRLRLFRSESPCNLKWAETISTLLGVPLANCQQCSYVGHPVSWSSGVLCSLHSFLSFKYDVHWPIAIVKHWHFSEYQLYGVFAENLTDISKYHHISTQELSLMHKWEDENRPKKLGKNDLDSFFSRDESFQFAMVSSASDTPVEVYQQYVRERYFK